MPAHGQRHSRSSDTVAVTLIAGMKCKEGVSTFYSTLAVISAPRQVIEVKDEGGRLMNDFTGRVRRDEVKPPAGTTRTLVGMGHTGTHLLDGAFLRQPGESWSSETGSHSRPSNAG